MIYFDNAATTFPKPEEVYEAVDNANRNFAFNAGRGTYYAAHQTLEMINETRQFLGDLVGVSGKTVSFESSATEALNLIIYGLGLGEGDTVYISPFEHNAVVRPLYNLKKSKNINIELLPFDKSTWEFDEEEANDLFTLKKPKAVFVSHISNVTGYILPFEKIFALSKKCGAINVLDCSQSLGVVNPSIANTDFIVFAGHKSLYATFGIAGFINLSGERLNIVKSGGTGSDSLNHDMPENGNGRYEAGSINSVAIAGLNQSLKWLAKNNVFQHEKELTDYAISKLQCISGIQLYLPINNIENILGIISLNVENYSPSDVGSILNDEYGVCVRTGYHCSPFVHEFIGSLDKAGTVRISFGAFSESSEVDQLIAALKSF